MSDKLRFGLIGSGSQGRYLSEAAAATGLAELVACADPNPAATQQAMRFCGYQRAYTDSAEMLAKEDLDAVIVATTHEHLQPCALAAIKAGKHVFVEKPMALTASQGRQLVTEARKAGRKLMVGYTLRFLPERILMKKLLDSGAIGEVVHILGGQMIGSMGGWLNDPARGGGPLLYIGSHITDSVLWAAGKKVTQVLAAELRPQNSVEKSIFITIRFENGLIAQVATSQQIGVRYGWLDVLGTAGRMRVEWESNILQIQSSKMDAYKELTSIRVPPTAYMPKFAPDARMSFAGSAYVRYWAAEFAEFICAIKEDRDPSVTGEDGVRVLEVIDAAFESARTGRAVPIT